MTIIEPSSASTIGMKLDAFLDTVSTSNIAFITFSLLFSYILLNYQSDSSLGSSSKSKSELFLKKIEKQSYSEQSTKTPQRTNVEEPQPRWYILNYLNYLFVFGLAFCLVFLAMNNNSASADFTNDTSTLLMFVLAWGTFLCYFFGFFGISFVDADEMIAAEQPTQSHASKPSTPSKAKIDKGCSTSTSSRSAFTSEQLKALSNEEIANLVLTNQLKDHELEKKLDPFRAVDVRRLAFSSKLSNDSLTNLPHEHALDYSKVYGANCEIVVGYIPIPVGVVGPLMLNGEQVYIPMATTEGCLVASTNRGCKAISMGSGAQSTVVRDGITRAPCLRMNSAKEACELKMWCETPEHFLILKEAFESTTSFGKLISADATVAGRNVYLRLRCFSGDAMGMNMVSKGSLAVIERLKEYFSCTLVALSGNMCTDKKAAATNWIEGRGKSCVVEAIIPKHVVERTLKTNVPSIVFTNTQKNLIGSAMAASIGGFNAHASNIVTAIFLATGQDPAQNVESSNCMTLMEETAEGDLWISCTMPSIEVGTVGGGTNLPAQASCLKVIGCKGGGEVPGSNAVKLAHAVAGATMAGELSLIAALASNTLVQAHMKHNRKSPSSSK